MKQNESVVVLQQKGRLAVISFNNPPVNACNYQIRQGILDKLDDIDTSAVDSVVLCGQGRSFMAGADLKELDLEPQGPTLPDVTSKIESFPLPVIAVMKGFTLGGGLEIALASDYRFALDGTTLGLPEVNVGVIPGAGGTQRLPRAIGMLEALDMIGSGKTINVHKAVKLGLVDRVIEDDSLENIEKALSESCIALTKRSLRERNISGFDHDLFSAKSKDLLKKSKGMPSVQVVLDLLAKTSSMSFQAGVELERECFLNLRSSPSARAMRYIFFAEKQLQKSTNKGDKITTVAVVGAGTMGSGICIAALTSGYSVYLNDVNEEVLESGRLKVEKELDRLLSRGMIDQSYKLECLARLKITTSLSELSGADLVIEAIIENLEAKQSLFKQLSMLLPKQVIFATNTSYLNVDSIFNQVPSADNVIGLHFFSPAHLMPLLEVVKGSETSDETLSKSMTFAKNIGKKAIVCRNSWGFVGNRIYASYRRQCEFLLEEGASVEQIDRAVEAYGFAMGPFKVADMSGLDIAWSMRKQTQSTRALSRYVGIPDLICELGRFGRKTGCGYYSYSDGHTPETDPIVSELITQYRQDNGILPKIFSDEEIQNRVIASIINEALLVLKEAVCESPEAIDIALVNGYGFPRWKGGPMYVARNMPRSALQQLIDSLSEVSGKGHKTGEIDILFNDIEVEQNV